MKLRDFFPTPSSTPKTTPRSTPKATPSSTPVATPTKKMRALRTAASSQRLLGLEQKFLEQNATPQKLKERKLLETTLRPVCRTLTFTLEENKSLSPEVKKAIEEVKADIPNKPVNLEQLSNGTIVRGSSTNGWTFVPKRGTGETPIFSSRARLFTEGPTATPTQDDFLTNKKSKAKNDADKPRCGPTCVIL